MEPSPATTLFADPPAARKQRRLSLPKIGFQARLLPDAPLRRVSLVSRRFAAIQSQVPAGTGWTPLPYARHDVHDVTRFHRRTGSPQSVALSATVVKGIPPSLRRSCGTGRRSDYFKSAD